MESVTNGVWKKQFFTMFSGQAFSIIGSNVVQFAITLHLALTTHSPIILTLAMLAGYLPQVILGPLMGAFVDRSNRKAVMIVADLFISVTSVWLMIYFFLGSPPFWFIFIVLMLRSVGQGFHEPALLASIPLIVPKNQLTRVGGYRQAIDSLALIAAPGIAATLMSLLPIAYIMIVDISGAVIASLILLIFVRIPPPSPLEEPQTHSVGLIKSLTRDMMFGIKELAKYPGLVILALALACAAFIYVPMTTLFVLLVSTNFNGGHAEIAAVQSAFGIGMLVGSLLLGIFDKIKKRVLFMFLTLIMMGIMLFVTSILPPSMFYLMVVLTVLSGLLFPIMTGPFFAMLQIMIHPSVLGRVTALVKSVTILATPIGLLIAGPVSELFGITVWVRISGIFVILLGVICTILPSIRALDTVLEQHRLEAKPNP